MLEIQPQRLTREVFAPFGDVIQIEGSNHFEINSGYAYACSRSDRRPAGWRECKGAVQLFLGRPRPQEIKMLEKHPLGSQAFYPVQ